jgi:hypothetical protein
MERYLSTGVTTIVALMAAHRSALSGVPGALLQKEFERIEADLLEQRILGRQLGTPANSHAKWEIAHGIR